MTGFLLTIPFSARFGDPNDTMRTVYLWVLGGAVVEPPMAGLVAAG